MMVTKIIIFLLYKKDSELFCCMGYSYSNEKIKEKEYDEKNR